jgi:hypothetical protein
MVLYGWIDHHAHRNYLRKTWLTSVGRRCPYFTFEQGELLFKGFADHTQGLVDSPRLFTHELDITVNLIMAMDRECKRHKIPFTLLRLPMKSGTKMPDPNLADRILQYVESHDVAVSDLRDTTANYFEKDGRPTAAWHRDIARRIRERLSAVITFTDAN